MLEQEGFWHAERHTLRVAPAEITVLRHSTLLVKAHDAERAGKETHLAPDATIIDDDDLPVL
jgi:hypothetical protein